jgi:F0F1-type ATP synthase assembly protein I
MFDNRSETVKELDAKFEKFNRKLDNMTVDEKAKFYMSHDDTVNDDNYNEKYDYYKRRIKKNRVKHNQETRDINTKIFRNISVLAVMFIGSVVYGAVTGNYLFTKLIIGSIVYAVIMYYIWMK